MKRMFINVPKVKQRKQLPSHLVVTKIHDVKKGRKSPHKFRCNQEIQDFDALDDRYYD